MLRRYDVPELPATTDHGHGGEAAPMSYDQAVPAASTSPSPTRNACRQRARPAAAPHGRAGQARAAARRRARRQGAPRRAPRRRRRRRHHRPGLRGRRPHRRASARWCWSPRSSTPWRRSPCSPRAASAAGRQMAAAMALGAQGVWCGSVWLTTEEAETHPRREGEVPRRDVVGHDALASTHRQARPPVAVGVDRRVGDPRHAGPAAACRCSRS